MGRKKVAIRRIENLASRQAKYAKLKDGILKKANELSILCDTDVALLMFSPYNITSFASKKRIEDIFLHFVDMPDEQRGGPIGNVAFLSEKLKELKNEAEMLEKIAVIEELKIKLDGINKRKHETKEKLRYYKPDVEQIDSVLVAGAYQQFLTSALQHIHKAKAKMLGNEIPPEGIENEEVQETKFQVNDAISVSDQPSINKKNGKIPMMDE